MRSARRSLGAHVVCGARALPLVVLWTALVLVCGSVHRREAHAGPDLKNDTDWGGAGWLGKQCAACSASGARLSGSEDQPSPQRVATLLGAMVHDIHLIVDRLREYKFEENLTLVTFGSSAELPLCRSVTLASAFALPWSIACPHAVPRVVTPGARRR